MIPLVTPHYFLADLYSFKWSEFTLVLPLINASAVAFCFMGGIVALVIHLDALYRHHRAAVS